MVQCIKSELKTISLFSGNHSVTTVFLSPDQERVCFEDHKISCNINKMINPENEKEFIIDFEIQIFPPDNKPGYEIECVLNGYFEVETDKVIDEDQMYNYHNTALIMVINYMRAHLRSLTHEGVYGPYIMPSIDLIDLLNKLNYEFEKAKQETDTPKKDIKKKK
jgi:preprotein translocase subunit SecB